MKISPECVNKLNDIYNRYLETSIRNMLLS